MKIHAKSITLNASKVVTTIAGSKITQYEITHNGELDESKSEYVCGIKIIFHNVDGYSSWVERDYTLLLRKTNNPVIVPAKFVEVLTKGVELNKGFYDINGVKETCKESAILRTFLQLMSLDSIKVGLPLKLNELHLRRLRRWTANMTGISFTEDSIELDKSWNSYYKLGWAFMAIRIAQGCFPKLTQLFIEKFEDFINQKYDNKIMNATENWIKMYNV